MNLKFTSIYPGDRWTRRIYGDFKFTDVKENDSYFLRLYCLVFCAVILVGTIASHCDPKGWSMFFCLLFSLMLIFCVTTRNRISRIWFEDFWGRVWINKMKGRGSSFSHQCIKELDDEGVTTTFADGYTERLPWSRISGTREGEDYFYFTFSRKLVTWLNKNDMTVDQVEELREWLIRQCKSEKGQIHD